MPLHLSSLEILSAFKLNQFIIQVLAHLPSQKFSVPVKF